MKPIRLLATAALVALAGCGSNSAHPPVTHVQASRSSLPPGLRDKPAPRMRLVDARTGRFDTASLGGRPYVVTFLYTRCRTTSPVIAEELRAAFTRLGKGSAAAVAVSVDPYGDSRAAVKRFLETHREPANFHYLIGSRKQLEPLWRKWYVAAQPSGAATSIHSAVLWFIDPRGRIADMLPAGVAVAPATIASKLRVLAR
jgi:cytochrome oxidase Cu insertion factor (SCO1/SenC/PrrC family)